ncbi:AAA family ATPase [Dietzia sp. WMMA184]|uniref:AAA family ATPase n=1 Tax=Dietzia sp. WMMA184 TaxID=2039808 RepID=UPI000BDF8FCF|nr:AAA family ATPase [Dietzia sp. WMMA184]
MNPRLDLVVGCNGAGKSTLVDRQLQPLLGVPFVNADEIAKRKWPTDPESHSYEAAKVAELTRNQLIVRRRSFIAETVFSHPSKLELIDRARDAGFRVVLHVLMVPEQFAVERVRLRVNSGGHSVPESKIRERYHRVWPLVQAAIPRCGQATIYSNERSRTRVVAQYINGILVDEPDWPDWTPATLLRGSREL